MPQISFTAWKSYEYEHILKIRQEGAVVYSLWYPRPEVGQTPENNPDIEKRITELKKHGYTKIELKEWFRLDGKEHSYLDRVSLYNPRRKTNLKEANEIWEDIKASYDYRCAYCGKKSRKLTKDHVKPVALHGIDSMANIVPACRECNLSKNARMLKDWPKFEKLQLHLFGQ